MTKVFQGALFHGATMEVSTSGMDPDENIVFMKEELLARGINAAHVVGMPCT